MKVQDVYQVLMVMPKCRNHLIMEFGGFMKWNTQTHRVLRCKLKEFKFKENNNGSFYAVALDNLTIIGDLADILHNIEAATGNPFVQRVVDEKLRKFVIDFPAYQVRLSPFLNGGFHDLSLGVESGYN